MPVTDEDLSLTRRNVLKLAGCGVAISGATTGLISLTPQPAVAIEGSTYTFDDVEISIVGGDVQSFKFTPEFAIDVGWENMIEGSVIEIVFEIRPIKTLTLTDGDFEVLGHVGHQVQHSHNSIQVTGNLLFEGSDISLDSHSQIDLGDISPSTTFPDENGNCNLDRLDLEYDVEDPLTDEETEKALEEPVAFESIFGWQITAQTADGVVVETISDEFRVNIRSTLGFGEYFGSMFGQHTP